MARLLEAVVSSTGAGESFRQRSARPLAKNVIKTWLRLLRETRKGVAAVRAETGKLMDEARAELNSEQESQ